VKQLETLHTALHKSSLETSRYLSAGLRNEARRSGWPDHIVRHMNVSYTKDGFNAHVHDDHHAEAMNLEYGTPSTQPTAAVRRFSNRMADAENFLTKRMYRHLGDL